MIAHLLNPRFFNSSATAFMNVSSCIALGKVAAIVARAAGDACSRQIIAQRIRLRWHKLTRSFTGSSRNVLEGAFAVLQRAHLQGDVSSTMDARRLNVTDSCQNLKR